MRKSTVARLEWKLEMSTISTSYFAKSAKNPNAISISRGVPKWYSGIQYPLLAPTWAMVKMEDMEEYTRLYNSMLSKLTPWKVVADLSKLAHNPILLCWEKPGEFCHRRLVAEWLQKELDIEVKELGPNDVSWIDPG